MVNSQKFPYPYGKYQVIELVGQGAFAQVFKAQDTSLNRPVALKILHPALLSDLDFVSGFLREAQTAAQFTGDHLVHIYEVGQEDGSYYIAMQYLPGGTLAQRLAGGKRLPLPEAIEILTQVAEALDNVHRAALVHRDIKPSNILFDERGRTYLSDFGISRAAETSTSLTAGKSGSSGTAAYFSPELAKGQKVDKRSDIYTLGIVAYEMLSGRPPFVSENLYGYIHQHIDQAPPPPAVFNPAISQAVQDVILRALVKDPGGRFPSAGVFIKALNEAAVAPFEKASTQVVVSTSAQPVPIQPRQPVQSVPSPQPKRGKSRLACMVIVSLVLVLVCGAAGIYAAMNWSSLSEKLKLSAGKTPTSELAVRRTDTESTKTQQRPPPSLQASETRMPPRPTSTLVPEVLPTQPPVVLAPTEPPAAYTPTSPPGAVDTATLVPPALAPTFPPRPTPVPVVDSSGAIVPGAPWENEGVSLVVSRVEMASESDNGNAAAHVYFRLLNKTGQKLLVDANWQNIHLEDSLGSRYMDWDAGQPTSTWVEAGANYDFDRYYTSIPGQRSRIPSSASYVTVVVDQLSRISGARWNLYINPQLQSIDLSTLGNFKRIGESWESEGISLMLKDLQVFPGNDNSNAAAKASFTLSNLSNQEMFVEIDYASIYLLDSLGRRFSDYYGGEIKSYRLAPGDSVNLERYYSDPPGARSRITRGATGVVVIAEKVPRLGNIGWRMDMVQKLSSMPAPTGPVLIGMPWESEGVSLVVSRVEMASESDNGNAAAHVYFRLFNKTGQKLLADVDWQNIHLEDGLGSRYVDWDAGQPTSTWIEAGASYDFDRYYTSIPGQRSRIPSSASYVIVVVDQLSGIYGAQWKMDINPQLQPVDLATLGSIKKVGENWESEDLSLMLKDLQILAGSDNGNAAAKANFVLSNLSNQIIYVEVDFAYIFLVDSFGQRFSDYYGGEIVSYQLNPGDSVNLERYYSNPPGAHSRVTTGSIFVVVWVEKLGDFQNALWSREIIR